MTRSICRIPVRTVGLPLILCSAGSAQYAITEYSTSGVISEYSAGLSPGSVLFGMLLAALLWPRRQCLNRSGSRRTG